MIAQMSSTTVGRARASRAGRVLDVTVATALLVVVSPLLLVVAAAVRVADGRPVLFRQERVGYGGRPFVMLKFRTMRPGGDAELHRALIRQELDGVATPIDGSFKVVGHDRVTRLGRVLRRSSIDELPQLFNVLRGDMSIVGPRPALAWEHEMFPTAARRRVEVRPGLTGLWQVSGRSTLTTPEMLELDLAYVRDRSLGLDLRILARTAGVLVRRDGAG